VPISRWLGYGGPHNPGARSFDAFAWASAIAASTTNIQVFATTHVPTIHPVMAAKMAATIDHVSGGRFGLNIVAGWQPSEIAMFGSAHREHDERYAVADEWTRLLMRLWTEHEPFDFNGRYYDSPGAVSEPKPIQKPCPPIMSAGISPAGRNFAGTHADVVFAAVADPQATAKTVAEIKQSAFERRGRELRVFGRAHITCRSTEADAKAVYDHYVRAHGDREAAINFLRLNMENSQTVDYDSLEMEGLVEAVIRGLFPYPMTGTPDQVVAAMLELEAAGLDGIAVTWNDYEEGLRQYETELLDRLVDAGLREPICAASAAAA
jgi:alkanesulfonate monooxygenase SsuD/methylene tetrahydromethanopterin reductase-like flavin-dependent oxidoreductase (luciferase family)